MIQTDPNGYTGNVIAENLLWINHLGKKVVNANLGLPTDPNGPYLFAFINVTSAEVVFEYGGDASGNAVAVSPFVAVYKLHNGKVSSGQHTLAQNEYVTGSMFDFMTDASPAFAALPDSTYDKLGFFTVQYDPTDTFVTAINRYTY